MAKIKMTEKIETKIIGEYQTVETEIDVPKVVSGLTFTGVGGLNGEYHFEEIQGSIVAKSLDEAISKANAYLAQLQGSRLKTEKGGE